jgi:hypothetical protein
VGLSSGLMRLFAKRRLLSVVKAGPDEVTGVGVPIGLLNINVVGALMVNIEEGPVNYRSFWGRENKFVSCVLISVGCLA